MLDLQLRPLKDGLFDPICKVVPARVSPLDVTLLAFGLGLLSCIFAAYERSWLASALWFANRALDCLDGALARHRGQTSDLGGFLDLFFDFIYYSLIPIACAAPQLLDQRQGFVGLAFGLAAVEASFHVNNFVLFFVAAVLEKRKRSGEDDAATRELTSVSMRPALIEGTESGLLFTLMLALPAHVATLSWTMAVLVLINVLQRVIWVTSALRK